MKNPIKIEVYPSIIKGYSYMYLFFGKKLRIEYSPKRYMRILGMLKNYKLS